MPWYWVSATLGLWLMSLADSTSWLGTVQPGHACSSDQVPDQLYQRSGPDWPLHAIDCVWVQLAVDWITDLMVTLGYLAS